jgi:hypothetical protein
VRKLAKGRKPGEAEQTKGVAMESLPFKRTGDKGASEALADANTQSQVEIAAAACLLDFSKAV